MHFTLNENKEKQFSDTEPKYRQCKDLINFIEKNKRQPQTNSNG